MYLISCAQKDPFRRSYYIIGEFCAMCRHIFCCKTKIHILLIIGPANSASVQLGIIQSELVNMLGIILHILYLRYYFTYPRSVCPVDVSILIHTIHVHTVVG